MPHPGRHVNADPPILDARGLVKRFGATRALDGVDLMVNRGEAVALMGANGAGKSTLVKILCGAMRPDRGTLAINGRAIHLADPAAARALGIATVHQAVDAAGVPGMTVAENLVLDALCTGRLPRFLSAAHIRRAATPVAAGVGLENRLDDPLSSLTLAERQLVGIARGLAGEKRLLILDEPTASLSAPEASRLFTVLDRLKAQGTAVILVSHHAADLRRIADRAVVLRDGRVAGVFDRPLDLPDALRVMVGALPDAGRTPPAQGPAILCAERLRIRDDGPPLDLLLRGGEVTVLFATLGAGKSRLLRTLFGAIPARGGAMGLDGKPWRPRNPRDAVRAGVFLAAEDRWRTSFPAAGSRGANIADVVALPHLPRWTGRTGLAPARQEGAAARDAIRRLGIVCRGPDDRLERLSGGNQQKVVLGRWSAVPGRVLLLDEPFAGVDVRARHDLIAFLHTLGTGTAVLLATADAEEALQAADRLLILRPDGLHDHGRPDRRDGAALLEMAGAIEGEAAA